MTAFPLIFAPLLPLGLALLAAIPLARCILPWAMILAPLPTLILAFSGTGAAWQDIPWVLMGVRFELDPVRAVFLTFTGFLWTGAAWSATIYLKSDANRTRFCVCFLLAMAGNIGLILAGDVVSFYTFFSMMSLASWGLVAHERGDFASFAGRSYIAFAIAGELALFSGLTLAAYGTQSLLLADIRQMEFGGLAMLFLCVGFGIKLGVVPLHLWLPLAHAAAPGPASAVLSGAMIKAGLFGALILLPIGVVPLEQAGLIVSSLGVVSVLLAALVGVTQTNPKAVLAYSSVGQMGLVAIGLGTGLAIPEAWGLILPALVLFAAHHAFAKAALFLGVPAFWSMAHPVARSAVLALLILPAAALAAAPWTSGALTKTGLKDALGEPGGFWGHVLDPVLMLSSVGTALLMLRFFWLLAQQAPKPRLSAWLLGPWSTMTMLAIGGVWLTPIDVPVLSSDQALNAIPIVIAIVVAGLVSLLFWALGLRTREVPPGEILAVFQFAERPGKPIGTLLASLPRPHQLGSHLPWPTRRHRANGGTALLFILVAIIAAGLWANPELRGGP